MLHSPLKMTSEDWILVEAVFALGTGSLLLGLWVLRKELSVRKWPQVSGTIVRSTTLVLPSPRGGEEVLPLIEYEFEYRGQSFKSAHWRIGNYSAGTRDTALEILSRYALGTAVLVSVNQDNPATSVLEHRITPLSWLPIAIGVGLIFLSLLPLLSK
jgi:hypothetical protein